MSCRERTTRRLVDEAGPRDEREKLLRAIRDVAPLADFKKLSTKSVEELADYLEGRLDVIASVQAIEDRYHC